MMLEPEDFDRVHLFRTHGVPGWRCQIEKHINWLESVVVNTQASSKTGAMQKATEIIREATKEFERANA